MEQSKIYRISLQIIGLFMFLGLLYLFICLLALNANPPRGFLKTLESISFTVIPPFFPIAYSLYLWKKRNEKIGFYWDKEGVVIDLKGSKIYWEEIEKIDYYDTHLYAFSKATLVQPHYTNHEKIRIRRKKWMPSTNHSISWISIDKPKDFHENLLNAWEEKRKLLK